MSDRIRLVMALALVLVLAACAGRSWDQARSEDSVAAYHRFLRDHSDSKYAAEARMRLAAARIRHKPSRKAFEHFRERFPDSTMLDELRPYVEEYFFTAARMRGTEEGYRAFLADFPDGAFAARAAGNAEYLAQKGFGGRLDALADFAARHPESDYAAEAGRTVATAAFRGQSSFRTVALVLDVDPETPGADRLERVFTQRAIEAYRAAGLSLVPVSGADDPRAARAGARLTIAHEEREVRTQLSSGTVAQPGILARTTVRLSQAGDTIWQDQFEHRASLAEQKTGVSVLFGVGTADYWKSFFVPVATWNTRRAARAPRGFPKAPADVQTMGSRAVVLFGDGDFQVFDIGDPASPALLAEYRRKRDLSKFSGVAFANQQIVAFGQDGIEVVRIAGGPVKRTAVFGREVVGSIAAVETAGGVLLAASNRGLLRYGADHTFHTLVPQEILDMATLGDRVLFTDGKSLYVSTVKLLEAGRVEGELRIGRGFRPQRVRVAGTSAVVLGERGVLWIDVSRPSRPRVVSRISTSEAGEVEDAAVLGGRLFLLGARGLQISDRSGERIVDSIDVEARDRLGLAGRHLVMIGDDDLQVVDATPFFASSAAAAPGP
jgi:hypothetical protein